MLFNYSFHLFFLNNTKIYPENKIVDTTTTQLKRGGNDPVTGNCLIINVNFPLKLFSQLYYCACMSIWYTDRMQQII